MNDRRRGPRRTIEATVLQKPRRQTERREGERRLHERIGIDLWLEHQAGREVSFRHVGDLSAGGVRLDHGFSYPVGSRVTLRFSLPDDPDVIQVAAEVLAVTPDEAVHVTSLRFIDLAASDQSRISAFVARLGDQQDT